MRTPRITIRRLQSWLAVVAVVMCGFIESPRVYRRWKYCREQAALHAEQAQACGDSVPAGVRRLERLTAIANRFAAMGPVRACEISSLINASGDPQFARWFFTPAKLQLLYGAREQRDTTPGSVYPLEAAWYLESNWKHWWTEDLYRRNIACSHHVEMEREYLLAASRPWRSLPRDCEIPPSRSVDLISLGMIENLRGQ